LIQAISPVAEVWRAAAEFRREAVGKLNDANFVAVFFAEESMAWYSSPATSRARLRRVSTRALERTSR